MSDEDPDWDAEWAPLEPAPEDEQEALFDLNLYTKRKGHNTRK